MPMRGVKGAPKAGMTGGRGRLAQGSAPKRVAQLHPRKVPKVRPRAIPQR